MRGFRAPSAWLLRPPPVGTRRVSTSTQTLRLWLSHQRSLRQCTRALPSQIRRFSVADLQSEPNVREPKTYIVVEMAKKNGPKQLSALLKVFEDFGVNLTNIESRMRSFAWSGPSFHIDFAGTADEESVGKMLFSLKQVPGVEDVLIQPSREVAWFPTRISDLDLTRDTLDGGTDLINEDHPGFSDQEYRSRRSDIIRAAHEYMHGQEIPRVAYNDNEVRTWGAVYERLQETHAKWACKEFLECMPKLETYAGYAPNNVPQLQDISQFLQEETGFTLRPVAGLLSARDFLNALAFRVFFSTQYIRHHGNPYYTPEPDICHELLGHVPLFANRAFADFSQQIGLASLGAPDEEIVRLSSVYWFTVEFGLLREGNEVKAFGAGCLSSFGELEWSCSSSPSQTCREMGSVAHLERPELVPFDPKVAALQPYPITTYQPLYFVANSLNDAKAKMDVFCDGMQRSFFPQYDPFTQTIRVTKTVLRRPRVSTVQIQREKQKEFFGKQDEAVEEQIAAM